MMPSQDKRATTMISSDGPLIPKVFDGTIWLIHGFKTKGKHFADIKKELESRGYKVKNSYYGWHFIFTIWKATRDAAQSLLEAMDDGDYAITHSNGFLVALKAVQLGANLDKIIAISPAADSDVELGAPFWKGSIHVFATQRDVVLRCVKWVPFLAWGDLGRIGYLGDDDRFKTTWMFPVIHGHSAWFLKHWWLCNMFERSWRDLPQEN